MNGRHGLHSLWKDIMSNLLCIKIIQPEGKVKVVLQLNLKPNLIKEQNNKNKKLMHKSGMNVIRFKSYNNFHIS